jgi:lysozyme
MRMDTEKMVDELVRDECRDGKPELRMYLDNSSPPRWTIGVGHNLSDKPITRAAAYFMLHEDLDEVVEQLDENIPWWRNLDEVRQRVVVNMCFNMGWDSVDALGRRHGLKYWPHTLSLIETHRFAEAATEMTLSKWASQVGIRAERLTEMMRNGQDVA